MSDERRPWERREGESSQAYAAFRLYRDLGPHRAHKLLDVPRHSVERWSAQWDWVARSTAWDDEQAMVEDAARLDALRQMHHTHQVVARTAMAIAGRALAQLDIERMSAGDVVRMIETAAALERQTLTQSVSELLGQGSSGIEDPWERIAHELSGA